MQFWFGFLYLYLRRTSRASHAAGAESRMARTWAGWEMLPDRLQLQNTRETVSEQSGGKVKLHGKGNGQPGSQRPMWHQENGSKILEQFLGLGSVNTAGRIILRCGAVPCSSAASLASTYYLSVVPLTLLHPSCDTRKCRQTSPNVPWWLWGEGCKTDPSWEPLLWKHRVYIDYSIKTHKNLYYLILYHIQ